MRNVCVIEGCEQFQTGKGWCTLHYQRWQRTGDPRHGTKTSPAAIASRFWSKVRQSGECWEWTAAVRKTDGYGAFRVQGRTVMAHRFAYEDLRVEIPEGLVLDHLCRNPRCVNPWHLEPVTDAINSRRGESPSFVLWRTGKCKRGHELHFRRDGHRYCRTCNRNRVKEYVNA